MEKFLSSLKLICIYKNVINDEIVSKFLKVLSEIKKSGYDDILASYTDFISLFYEKEKTLNFFNYIKFLIFTDENLVSKNANNTKLSNEILITAEYELSVISNIFEYNYNFIKDEINERFPKFEELTQHLPIFYTKGYSRFYLKDILNTYKTNGYGMLSCYNAFKFDNECSIIPVKNFDCTTFKDLKNYEYQKNIIRNNTLSFLNGNSANNILLYGDRGCGKSSTVKALINEFSSYNLKIVQIQKDNIVNLPELYEKLRDFPAKFIIFADDISFEEDDKNFSAIKAVLEGSITSTPKNTLLYATTNRIHLIKESFKSREGDEIHYNDTIDEAVSLSDRFGIVLTFSSLNKKEYVEIVTKIASDYSISINDEFLKSAVSFTMQKGIMTPRIARQFITDYLMSKK